MIHHGAKDPFSFRISSTFSRILGTFRGSEVATGRAISASRLGPRWARDALPDFEYLFARRLRISSTFPRISSTAPGFRVPFFRISSTFSPDFEYLFED